jgi:hypothetical protein
MRIALAGVLLALMPAQAETAGFQTLRYSCDRGVEVPATYVTAEDQAVVVIHVDGSQITLVQRSRPPRACAMAGPRTDRPMSGGQRAMTRPCCGRRLKVRLRFWPARRSKHTASCPVCSAVCFRCRRTAMPATRRATSMTLDAALLDEARALGGERVSRGRGGHPRPGPQREGAALEGRERRVHPGLQRLDRRERHSEQ